MHVTGDVEINHEDVAGDSETRSTIHGHSSTAFEQTLPPTSPPSPTYDLQHTVGEANFTTNVHSKLT